MADANNPGANGNPAVRKGHKGFLKGKSGNPKERPKGSRNRRSQLTDVLTPEQVDAITNALVDLAIAGDTAALKQCMALIYSRPQPEPQVFDLPKIVSLDDVPVAIDAVLQAGSAGALTPFEIVTLVEQINKLKVALLERDALEQRKVRATVGPNFERLTKEELRTFVALMEKMGPPETLGGEDDDVCV